MIKIVKTENYHIEGLKNNIREMDKKEAFAQTGIDASKALELTCELSGEFCYCGLKNKKVVGIYGVAPDRNFFSNNGTVYLIGSKSIDDMECSKYLLKEGKKFIEAMLTHFCRLENLILAENTKSIEWLKYLGFTISESYLNYNGFNFKHFYIERKEA